MSDATCGGGLVVRVQRAALGCSVEMRDLKAAASGEGVCSRATSGTGDGASADCDGDGECSQLTGSLRLGAQHDEKD
eukprot:6197153-Pleurochrysis_carterae.AAC.2